MAESDILHPAAQAQGAQSAGQNPFADFQRLHPLTLAYRIVVSLPPFLLALIPMIRRGGVETYMSVFLGVIYGVFALPWIVLYYVRFMFKITPREVVIHSGILTRQRRSIPLERIQNVEIEQRLMQRALGIARVRISTAGSASSEGTLDSVTLTDARRIRQQIRAYQQQAMPAGTEAPPPLPGAAASEATAVGVTGASPAMPVQDEAEPEGELIYRMPARRVFLAGSLRFSLVYIAIFLSLFQYVDIAPERIFDWFDRGGLDGLQESNSLPGWALFLLAFVFAALLSWISGIVTTVNRYFGFTLRLEGRKAQTKSGLLSLVENTIPLPRMQALHLRANALMRKLGWGRLEVQTMGVVTQSGQKVAMPLARYSELWRTARRLYPFELPDAKFSVSRLTIRRAFVRYSVALLVFLGLEAWLFDLNPNVLWGLLLLPALYGLAVLRYRNHTFSLTEDAIFVRYGVFQHRTWVVPLNRVQTLSLTATLFQRRLGLATLNIDTAGASAGNPTIIDLPAAEAAAWRDQVYAAFQSANRNSS